jgi:hypothetical protein
MWNRNVLLGMSVGALAAYVAAREEDDVDVRWRGIRSLVPAERHVTHSMP